MTKLNIQVGEKWFVKLPGARKLTLVTIQEIRTFIVLFDIHELSKFGLDFATNQWHEINDIDFVEQDI